MGIEDLARWVSVSVFNFEASSRAGEAVSFFIIDSIEIFALLIMITLIMGAVRFVIPLEKMRDFLVAKNWYGFDLFLASCFGAVTPFCSCSSIPLFIGFLGAGVPLGVTFAFLITSPLINEVAVALMVGLFGWKVTLMYVVSGLVIGVAGGYILGRMRMERYVESFLQGKRNGGHVSSARAKVLSWEAGRWILREAWGIIKQVTPYLLIGVAVGAAIHGYMPQGLLERYAGQGNLLAVPVAVVAGVPFYSGAHSVIPIIQPLVEKGVPLGTALAFMMAVVGLSFPEMMILKKVMKWPLLVSFFGITAMGMVIIGYVLNLIVV